MPPLPITTSRIRVWLFGYAAVSEDISKSSANISTNLQIDYSDPTGWANKKFYEIGGDDFVIVRVEEVTPFEIIVLEKRKKTTRTCNVVIPVDAKNEDALLEAKRIIDEDLGIQIIKEVRVISHNPWPPHKAHGFITPDEFYVFKDEHVGRQFHNSPGSNKWG